MLRIATCSRLPCALYSHAPALTYAARVLWSTRGVARMSSRRLFENRRPDNQLYPSQTSQVIQPKPPHTWISDYGNRLTDVQTSALNAKLGNLKAGTGAEFAICAIDNLGLTHSYGHEPEAFGRFSRSLFDEWGIGRCGINDGLLLVVFCTGRRVEIVCGKGLMIRSEKFQTPGLLRMQQDIMVPLLRQRDFGGAIEAGALALVEAVYESAPTTKPIECDSSSNNLNGFGGGKSSYREEESDSNKHDKDARWNYSKEWSWMIYPAIIFITPFVFMSWKEWQKRRCLKCGAQTIKDVNGDLKLSSGKQLECKLGSCSYESRVCPNCSTTRKLRQVTASSAYVPCRKCGHVTALKTKRTTVKPTYGTPGTSLVKETCQHCREQKCYESTIPALQDATERNAVITSSGRSLQTKSDGSPSSPSSSSGGFGGGSSRGGSSAGTSWFMSHKD